MKEPTARDVMTTPVLSVRDSWPVQRLAEFLIEHGISGAPVLDQDGVLSGMVSVTDIARHDSLPGRAGARHRPSSRARMRSDRSAADDLSGFEVRDEDGPSVRDIMTQEVFDVDAEDPVSKVAEIMITGRIHRLLVTEGGNVAGVVTALDLLRLIRDGIAREAA